MCHRAVEVDEDEVDVTEMMLKRARIKPADKTGVIVVKEGVEEVSLIQKWNFSRVASKTTTQETTDCQPATIVVRPVI